MERRGDLDLTPGLARDYQRQVMNADGTAFGADRDPSNASPFQGSDTLSATVWAGASTASIIAPACTWLDATGLATFQMSISATQSALLTPGIYRFQTSITRGGSTGKIDEGRIRVGIVPGTDTLPLAFTVRSDLIKYAPWLEDLAAADDETAFADEQARATSQLVSDLVNLERRYTVSPQAGQPGFNAFSLFGRGGRPPNKWLRDNLIPLVPHSTPAADVLPNRGNVLPNLIQPRVSTALLLYDEVLEICARRAICYICERQISMDMDKSWLKMSKVIHFRTARSLFQSYRFMIDLATPQTGWSSITIEGGRGNLG